MAAQAFSMIFDGYWREPNKGGIPAESGVYCVYAGVFNVAGAVCVYLPLTILYAAALKQTTNACPFCAER